MIRLVLVGTSHHHAPVELRERVALEREAAQALAARLAEGGREAVCLSTCNRTELYVAADDADAAERDAVAALAALEPEVEPALYRLQDRAAVLHLFRVAAALTRSCRARARFSARSASRTSSATTGVFLDRVFRQALHAGRKVRAQTAIGESPASVSSAAAALAEQVFGTLDGRSILLLGAGKMSEQASRNLRSRGARSRSSRTARPIARRSRPRSRRSTSSSRRRTRRGSCSMPRPSRGQRKAVAAGSSCSSTSPSRAISIRRSATSTAVTSTTSTISSRSSPRRSRAAAARPSGPSRSSRPRRRSSTSGMRPSTSCRRSLRFARKAEEIRAAELRKADALLGRLDDSQRKAVESVTSQIVNKLLHLPTVRMKQAAAAADGVLYAEAVRHLFGLGEDER